MLLLVDCVGHYGNNPAAFVFFNVHNVRIDQQNFSLSLVLLHDCALMLICPVLLNLSPSLYMANHVLNAVYIERISEPV